jgi:hypothetical protein
MAPSAAVLDVSNQPADSALFDRTAVFMTGIPIATNLAGLTQLQGISDPYGLTNEMAPSAALPDSGIVRTSVRFGATDEFLASRRAISWKFLVTRSLAITSDPGASGRGLNPSGWLEVTWKFMESTAIDATKNFSTKTISTRNFEPTESIEVSGELKRSFAFNVSLDFASSWIVELSSSFGGTQNVTSAEFARTLAQDPSALTVSTNYAHTSVCASRQFAVSALHQSIVFDASKNLTASNFGVDEAGRESRGFITKSFIAAIAAGLVCLLLAALIILYIRRKHGNELSEQEMAYETEAKAIDLTENESDDLSHGDEWSVDDFDRAIESAFGLSSDKLFHSDCDEIF